VRQYEGREKEMKVFEIVEAVTDRWGNPVRDGSGKPVRSASDPDTMQKLQSINSKIQASNREGNIDAASAAGMEFMQIVNDEVMPDLVKTLDKLLNDLVELARKNPDHPEVQKYKGELRQAMQSWKTAKAQMQSNNQQEAHGNSKVYDKCWKGYKKVPGKKRGEKGSCVKETATSGGTSAGGIASVAANGFASGGIGTLSRAGTVTKKKKKKTKS
jgi:hypothetical protein